VAGSSSKSRCSHHTVKPNGLPHAPVNSSASASVPAQCRAANTTRQHMDLQVQTHDMWRSTHP
jgi:hypothetical protein